MCCDCSTALLQLQKNNKHVLLFQTLHSMQILPFKQSVLPLGIKQQMLSNRAQDIQGPPACSDNKKKRIRWLVLYAR